MFFVDESKLPRGLSNLVCFSLQPIWKITPVLTLSTAALPSVLSSSSSPRKFQVFRPIRVGTDFESRWVIVPGDHRGGSELVSMPSMISETGLATYCHHGVSRNCGRSPATNKRIGIGNCRLVHCRKRRRPWIIMRPWRYAGQPHAAHGVGFGLQLQRCNVMLLTVQAASAEATCTTCVT